MARRRAAKAERSRQAASLLVAGGGSFRFWRRSSIQSPAAPWEAARKAWPRPIEAISGDWSPMAGPHHHPGDVPQRDSMSFHAEPRYPRHAQPAADAGAGPDATPRDTEGADAGSTPATVHLPRLSEDKPSAKTSWATAGGERPAARPSTDEVSGAAYSAPVVAAACPAPEIVANAADVRLVRCCTCSCSASAGGSGNLAAELAGLRSELAELRAVLLTGAARAGASPSAPQDTSCMAADAASALGAGAAVCPEHTRIEELESKS